MLRTAARRRQHRRDRIDRGAARRRGTACARVVHTRNRGYGDAVRTGIAAARMPWVLLTDADLQFDLSRARGLPAARRARRRRLGLAHPAPDRRCRRAAHAAAWNWLVRRDVPPAGQATSTAASSWCAASSCSGFALESSGGDDQHRAGRAAASPQGARIVESSASTTARGSRASRAARNPRVVAARVLRAGALRRSLHAARS